MSGAVTSEISARWLQILQHSLGLDQFGQGIAYRRYFVTNEGSIDHPDCMAMVAEGLMSRRAGSSLSATDDVFLVTVAGQQFVATNSPPPPKLTRGQRRYQQWLDADCGLSFGDWLKSHASGGGQ